MGIKLSEYIKDTKNVFTEAEAMMIYEAAGYKLIKETEKRKPLKNDNSNKN